MACKPKQSIDLQFLPFIWNKTISPGGYFLVCKLEERDASDTPDLNCMCTLLGLISQVNVVWHIVVFAEFMLL